jgi:hypothetical protein
MAGPHATYGTVVSRAMCVCVSGACSEFEIPNSGQSQEARSWVSSAAPQLDILTRKPDSATIKPRERIWKAVTRLKGGAG